MNRSGFTPARESCVDRVLEGEGSTSSSSADIELRSEVDPKRFVMALRGISSRASPTGGGKANLGWASGGLSPSTGKG